MPLTGTGPTLGLAIDAAREAVLAAFRAAHPEGGPRPSEADFTQLRRDVAIAEGNAIVAHFTGPGGVAAVVGAGPSPGNIV